MKLTVEWPSQVNMDKYDGDDVTATAQIRNRLIKLNADFPHAYGIVNIQIEWPDGLRIHLEGRLFIDHSTIDAQLLMEVTYLHSADQYGLKQIRKEGQFDGLPTMLKFGARPANLSVPSRKFWFMDELHSSWSAHAIHA